ncbi:hypothetical protein M2163_000402 [Streptomyces sp. SAI-135]|jgi:hypothetical protein|nr:hypothetical protein [Streptomyces sp. SAI-090]MDH6573975.1 hypothetical protein [Streptomyces sp. SAI-117]MDH6581288.1 hypothetical protein [Streptomyces sp. SAI-133]MDH6613294.1 hypothetical protein [Streptomyces sp. SAI-135]
MPSTSVFGHDAAPLVEPADTSAPLNFDDPGFLQ